MVSIVVVPDSVAVVARAVCVCVCVCDSALKRVGKMEKSSKGVDV